MIDINMDMAGSQIKFLDADGKTKRKAEIVKEIGSGATSVVFQVKLDDGTLAALKYYRDTDSRLRYYESELTALPLFSQFPDPNVPITPIFLGSSGESDSDRFVVMEFISAPSLEACLAEGVFGEKDACSLGVQLYKFIQTLHQNHKSYPDLKKENFRWENSRLRVIDIGGLYDDPTEDMIRRDLFETGLVLLSQCISKMPDFDRMLSRISGQPIAKVLSSAQPALGAGLSYVFTRLFHDDYGERYQNAGEAVYDLMILEDAYSVSKASDLGKKLDPRIKELQKYEIMKPAVRWQKKKEVFLIASVLDGFSEKDSRTTKILRDAGEVYTQISFVDGIEKFMDSPSKARSIFKEIINGDDWGSQPGSKDRSWRWYWASEAAINCTDSEDREKIKKFLVDIDSHPDDASGLIANHIPINDSAYQYIPSQILFLDNLRKRNLAEAESNFKLLPVEYQNSRRAELEGIRDGIARQGGLSDILTKIRDGELEYGKLMEHVFEARRRLDSLDLADQWWLAILTAAEDLTVKREFSQAADILQAGLTYPGYPKELTECLKITKALAKIQMDLALGDVVHAARSCISLAEFRENMADVFKQSLVNFRNEIYQQGDLEACGLLEQTPAFENWVLDVNKWEEVKKGMQTTLETNKSAARRLFDKLTLNKPVLGEGMGFPVRLLIQEDPKNEKEIKYIKALLGDAYRQLIPYDNKLKDQYEKGLEVLNERLFPANQSILDIKERKKKIKNNLDLCKAERDGLLNENSSDKIEAWKKKIILVMSEIYQVLRIHDDDDLQNEMKRALGLLGADFPGLEIMDLITEIKKKSPLKEMLDEFALGSIGVDALKAQLHKEIFRDRNEIQRFEDYISKLMELRKIEDKYKQDSLVNEKLSWIKSLKQLDFILPGYYWKNSRSRKYLEGIVDNFSHSVPDLKKKKLRESLALAVYAAVTLKTMDQRQKQDEGRS